MPLPTVNLSSEFTSFKPCLPDMVSLGLSFFLFARCKVLMPLTVQASILAASKQLGTPQNLLKTVFLTATHFTFTFCTTSVPMDHVSIYLFVPFFLSSTCFSPKFISGLRTLVPTLNCLCRFLTKWMFRQTKSPPRTPL